MPQRSPSPGSFKRHGDNEVVDRYRSRRGATDSYNRGADRETREGYRGSVSERDRRRDYRDNDDDHYRRRDNDDRRRRRDEYDDGGRRRDDGDRSRREGDYRGGGRGEAELCAVGPAGGRDEHGEECGRDEHAAQVQRAARGAQAPRWRLYVFKGEEQLELLHIHRQSAYLIGRDRTVADIPLEHPSCSKQHSVIQYRLVQQKDELGVSKAVIKPFVIDLESTNGTHVNGEAIPTSRYYELKAGDVLKFGTSNREYVLLHDGVA